jgi:hypothetical protein
MSYKQLIKSNPAPEVVEQAPSENPNPLATPATGMRAPGMMEQARRANNINRDRRNSRWAGGHAKSTIMSVKPEDVAGEE